MIYIILVVLHFTFDWILQPRHIAKIKGNSKEGINAVFQHIVINIIPFSILFSFILVYLNFSLGHIISLVCANLISHTLIDIYLPKGKNERQMINWTALDQMLHLSILFILIN